MAKHLAWLESRAPLWTAEELAKQVEDAIDLLVEHEVLKAPKAVRDELRGVMREMMENDPTVSELVQRIRVARR